MRSAGIVILRKTEGGFLYLLLRAYNYWDFPKGLVEDGEDPFKAATREAEEEAGITDLKFSWGHAYHETPPYGRGKVARYYVAETDSDTVKLPVSHELGRPEHHEARWMSFDEARSKALPRIQAVLDWARTMAEKK